MISLGASNNIGIGVVVSIRDNFTAKAKSIENAFDAVYGKVDKVMKDNLRSMQSLSAGAMAVGTGMLYGLKKASDVSADFHYLMAAVGAVTRSTSDELTHLTNRASKLAATTIYNAREVAGAMKYLGMAGFSAKDIDETIYAVTKLGEATGEGISGKNQIADYMTNMMTSFNMRASDSMRMADILTAASVKSNVDIHDLHEAIKYSGADLTTLGVSFEEAAALMSVLGNAGLRGSIAGTSIGNMAQKLAKGVGEFRTTRQTKILEQMGLTREDVVDAQGNMLSIIDIIENINKAMSSGNIDRMNQIEGFFGRRGQRAFAAVIRDPKIGVNLREMHRILTEESSGETLRIAAERMDNLKGDTIIMKSAWESFQIAIGDATEPLMRPLVQGITKILNVLTVIVKTPIGKWSVAAIAVLTVLGTVAAGVMFTISTIGVLLLSTTVNFGTMRAAGVWAWNSMIAAALRYKAVASVIEAMHGSSLITMAGGRYRGAAGTKRAGQFIGTRLAERYMQMFTRRGIGPFFRGLVRLVPIVGRLGSLFRVLTGPVGILITVVGTIIGWNNILKTGIFVLGQFLNSVGFLADFIVNFLSNPFNVVGAYRDAEASYVEKQKNLYEKLGMEAVGRDIRKRLGDDSEARREIYNNTNFAREMRAEIAKGYDRINRERYTLPKKQVIETNVWIDQMKVGKATKEVVMGEYTNDLARQLTMR